MTATKLNKHAQRTQATQDKLLRAAETVFVRDGYEGAELGEIAALAGRTKGAIYAHFKSKEDVFLALIREHAMKYRVRMEELMKSSTGAKQNRALFREQCLNMADDATWAMLLLEFKLFALRHPESKAQLDRYYAELLPEGQEARLADLLGPAHRGKDVLSRTVAVRAMGPLLGMLAIEAMFAPKLLDVKTRHKVATRIFEALVPESSATEE